MHADKEVEVNYIDIYNVYLWTELKLEYNIPEVIVLFIYASIFIAIDLTRHKSISIIHCSSWFIFSVMSKPGTIKATSPHPLQLFNALPTPMIYLHLNSNSSSLLFFNMVWNPRFNYSRCLHAFYEVFPGLSLPSFFCVITVFLFVCFFFLLSFNSHFFN